MEEFCFARLSVEKARQLAQKCIDHINSERAKRDKATEEEYFADWNKPSLFQKLFRIKKEPFPYTKEHLMRYRASLDTLSRLVMHYPSDYAYGTLDKCKAILVACDRSDDGFVFLSGDTLKEIQ